MYALPAPILAACLLDGMDFLCATDYLQCVNNSTRMPVAHMHTVEQQPEQPSCVSARVWVFVIIPECVFFDAAVAPEFCARVYRCVCVCVIVLHSCFCVCVGSGHSHTDDWWALASRTPVPSKVNIK